MASFYFVNGGQSLQTAIANAAAGDTIMVGTGTFSENLIIDKKLNIISLHGAASTIINGSVTITGSEVNFGDTDSGFTINPGASATAAIALGAGVHDVHIEGNTLNGNATAAASGTHYDLFGAGGESNIIIENNIFSGTADELLRIDGEANGVADSHNVQIIGNTFSGTTTSGGTLAALDADGSSITGNTFSGAASTALSVRQTGDTVASNNNFASFGSGTDIATVDSFDLRNVTGAENLTLLDGASNTQTFDDMATGSIANGENGWTYTGSNKDQEIVDQSGNHVFRFSSDSPGNGDFGGPYSPALNVAAGESTAAAYQGHSIKFTFQAVNGTPDNSHVEVDLARADGSDRNSFMVIESSSATNGIRIAVNEPLTVPGDHWTNDNFDAFIGNRTLISGVDPTVSHEIELRTEYVDGQSNDVIKVYLDGKFIGTTTTFENYRDFALGQDHEVAADQNVTSRLLFRARDGGLSHDGPGGQQQGFYFDNISSAVYNNTNGTGTESANVITGNSGDNTLSGLGGNDTLNGGGGNDTLIGGAGNDTLDGGAGIDTASYSGNLADYGIVFDGTTATVTDNRDLSPDGQDTAAHVGRLDFADHDVLLVGAGSDYKTIQSAIDAASAGDTILIGAGTYNEHIIVNKAGLHLLGVGPGVVIEGSFRSDNSITGSTADFFKTAAAYTGAAGNGVTIAADNVSLENLTISSFLTDIELGDGINHTLIKNVNLSDAVFGINKSTTADVTDLNIIGGQISQVYEGLNFAKSPTHGDGIVDGMTINGTVFEHITQKGIYIETLLHALITDITMNDVGQFGGGQAFGAKGLNGNGIDINLKYELGLYTDITIQNFHFTDVGLSNGLGTSHANAAAISVKARDDATSYNGNPADFVGSVVIKDGTIDGTSTGIRAGEAGKNVADPAIEISNVAITNAVHSATHGDVANVTQSVETVTLTDGADTLIASPSSTGAIVIHAGGGADNVTAGSGDDTLDGGAGNDTLHGAGGVDTAVYSGLILPANVTQVADIDPLTAGDQPGWQVSAGAEGTDTLDDIEIIDNSGHNILLVGNGGFATIQAAIDAASEGDTIMVAAGTYTENVNFNKSVTVLGSKYGVSGTGAGRDAADGVGETTIIGRSDITASGAVTIDGVRFLNDATTTGGGPGDPTLQIQNGNHHIVTNSIFYSTVFGGARPSPDDRAIAMPVIASGDVTISDNYFTGSKAGAFGDASWGREIWFDGGGVDLSVIGNTFEYGRTALNLDMTGDSEVTVQNNTFKTDGTAIAVGVDTDNLHIIDNTMQNVGDDFNLRNLGSTTFDADPAVAAVTPADPANPGTDAVAVLGGDGNDTFYGTEGNDFLRGNDLNPGHSDNDTLYGRGGADLLMGDAGDDTLDGGAGSDTLDGGAGIDTAVGYSNTATLAVSGGSWTVADGADTDTLTSVEKVVINGHNYWLVGAGGFASIQAAIDAASAGDTVLIADGHYVGNVTLKSGITLIGESEAGTVIDGTMLTPATLTGTTVSKMSVHNVGDTMLLDMRGTTDITDTVFDHVTFSLSGDFTGAVPIGNGQVSGIITLHDGADDDSAGLTFQHVTMASNDHVAGSTAFVYTLVQSVGGAKMVLDDVTLSGTASGTSSGLGAQWNMSPQDSTTQHAAVEIMNSHTSGGGNFYVSGFDSVSIHDNTFDGQGVALNGVKNATVTGNLFENISDTFTANGTHHRGLMIEDTFGSTGDAHITVTGNTFQNITSVDGAISFQRFTDGTPTDLATFDRLSDVLISGNTFTDLGGGVNPIYVNATYFGAGAALPPGFNQGQVLIGTSGADTITDASTDAMSIFAGPGDDTITGGVGNDAVSGGTGIDTATYAATLTAASFSYDQANHRWTVNAGAEGTDTLTGVEVVTDGAGHRFRLVDGSGLGGYAHIQDAVDAALADDFILIAPGTYTESKVPAPYSLSAGGLYINTAGLTLRGYSSVDGLLITSAAEAKLHGPTVIAGAQTDFGSNHFIGYGGDNVTIEGLHLQAGPETDNKILEIWADNVTVTHNFIDTNIGGTTYSNAVAIYLNDNGTTSDEISSYTIDHNIMNEGVVVANGVGDPPGVGANQQITNNTFEGTFDLGTGAGRYDTIVVNGQVPGVGWLLAPTEFPTVSGNTFANNTTPFLFRGREADVANIPTAADIAQALAANGNNNLTYAYVLKPDGDLRVADADDGAGAYHYFAVTNTLDTLNLALDAGDDNVFFGSQRFYILAGDTVVIQSGDSGAVNSAVMVDNLTIKATQHSVDLNLTLATLFADGTTIVGGVNAVTLADYASGLGANVDVTGNTLGNTITGNSGNNTLFGMGGDDTIQGNGGNDFIDGGDASDTVVYAGTRASYQVDNIGGGQIRVIDLRGGSPDGTDTIQNVENFQFADGTFTAASVLNDPPTGSVTITGIATENQTLTANSTLGDADGLGALHYQWKRDGVNVGTDQSTYTLVDADVGHTMSVVVSYTDLHGTAESVTSAPTATVGNVNTAPTGTVTISGTPTEDQTLTASNTLADGDGLGTLHYQWKRDGADVGSDQSTYTLDDADVGHQISVVVSYIDGHGTSESVTGGPTAAVANVNDAPTGGVTIDGTATEDQTLTAITSSLADADGLGTLHYQWKRDGADVGSDQSTYTLGDDDVGHQISVVVSYTDGHGTDEAVTGGPTTAVGGINDAPVAQSAPAVGNWNVPIIGDAHATDTDLPAQALTYSLVGANGGALHGTVSMTADGHYTYTPAANYSGSDSFQFRANDGFADSNTATISLTINNPGAGGVAPAAIDDTASVDEYQTVSGNVITGVPGGGADSDPTDDSALHLIGILGGALDVPIVGTYGSLTMHADGSYSYVADHAEVLYAGISGTDVFTYTLAGTGGAATDAATLTFTVNGVNTGTSGDDHVIGGPTGEWLFGGDGNDTMLGNGGNDVILGEDGNDVISGGAGDDVILGGAGDDQLSGDGGNDKINAGDGNDVIWGGDGNDELGGGTGDDIIIGGAGNDVIFGEDGNDVANGEAGDDIIVGGAGNDSLGGGIGDDILIGGDGDDLLWGEDGNDQLNGGAGADILVGGAGNDTLGGGEGNDILVGQAGADVLFGEGGDDKLNGGDDNDILIGGDGNDELGGGAGNDDLSGGAGNDAIFGEDGIDTINGGTGDDILIGGAGGDFFVFTNGDGNDTIVDFAHGSDHIWFNGASLHSFADVTAHATYNAGANVTTISYTGGTLTLNGVALSTLNAGDFIFT